MTGEQPILPAPPPPESLGAPPPERVPFWGYADVFLMAGLALPCIYLAFGFVRLAMWVSHLHLAPGAESVFAMLLGYCLLFLALKVIFQVQYDRPFWRSLGWTWTGVPVLSCVIYGFGTLFLVGMVSGLAHSPPTQGPLIDMLKDRSAFVLMAIFGTIAAPLFEELAFRGFLQPLLVRNLGAIGGVVVAAALFGGLHYSEYGDSWRSAVLVGLAGAAFGTMRQVTGSTAAAAIMHAAFNGLQFVAMLNLRKNGLH